MTLRIHHHTISEYQLIQRDLGEKRKSGLSLCDIFFFLLLVLIMISQYGIVRIPIDIEMGRVN